MTIREYRHGRVVWYSLADVLQSLRIHRELANDRLLLAMIPRRERMCVILDGERQWLITDDGAIGLAVLVPSRLATQPNGRHHPRGRSPVFVQIYNYYSQAIASGEIADGTELPSRTAVGEVWNVDRVTVGKAWRMLRENGFIRAQRLGVGRGPGMCCVVVGPPEPVEGS